MPCIYDYDKNRIVTCEKCLFGFELGYKQISGQVAQKHTANNLWKSSILANLQDSFATFIKRENINFFS